MQRRGGRKRIVAPDGSDLAPATKPYPTARWSRRSRGRGAGSGCWTKGRFASVRDLAEAEHVRLSYVSRILRLTLLTPDIVERILDGGGPSA